MRNPSQAATGPWYAAWRITQLVGGKVRFVMASSGHIAGIINPVASKKGAYWVEETGQPAAKPEEYAAHLLELYGKCLAAIGKK